MVEVMIIQSEIDFGKQIGQAFSFQVHNGCMTVTFYELKEISNKNIACQIAVDTVVRGNMEFSLIHRNQLNQVVSQLQELPNSQVA